MSSSGGQKENHTSNADKLRDSKDDGTAARTRPFSFEEIMERRKNKELSQSMNDKVRVLEIISRNDTVQDMSARLVPLRGGRETIRLSSVIERPAMEEHVRENNRGKEDSLHMREEKSVRGISCGIKELHYKEAHASRKEGMQVKANRKRESAAALQSNLISEGWNGDNRGEMEKKIHSGSKNYERRGDPKGRRLRREIRNVGYRDEIEQKIHSRIGNEQPRSYREERARRNELRNTGTRGEIDRKNNSRSNNNEWPSNKFVRVPGKRECKTDQRIHRSKDDKWSRNDSDAKTDKAYIRDSVINDRYADRSEGKFEKERKRKRHNADDIDVRDKNAVNKPDLGRSRDSEVLEEEKELPGSRHENSRMKRKRSRSEDRGKNRERSPSLSREARKVVSYNGRKVGDSLSHSLKDTPGKQHEEMERSKFSSNGLGNHYRGHGGSTSGLGGYSPRKRKTENVVRPLSPTNGSLERKNAGWDIPPIGVKDTSGSVTQGPQLSDHQVLSLNVNELVGAVTAALNASKPLPGASGFFHAENASVDSIQLTESTRPMRQLYIENIPASASEKDVMEYLNSRLVSSGVNHIQGKQPCISCIVSAYIYFSVLQAVFFLGDMKFFFFFRLNRRFTRRSAKL